MTKSGNTQQGLFSDTEQFLCKCGCNQYGFRSKRGRKREYIDATHKKRVQRAKLKERQNETRVVLTPKGLALAETLSKTSYERVWDMLSLEEQWVHELSTHHPSGVVGFWKAIMMLQRRAEKGTFADFSEILRAYGG